MIARVDNGQIRGRFVRGVSSQISILPEPLRNFLRRRFSELLGVLLLSLGIAFAISIADYNSLDPSINSSGPSRTFRINGVACSLGSAALTFPCGFATPIFCGSIVYQGGQCGCKSSAKVLLK